MQTSVAGASLAGAKTGVSGSLGGISALGGSALGGAATITGVSTSLAGGSTLGGSGGGSKYTYKQLENLVNKV